MAKFRKKPIVVDAVRVTAADWNGQSFDGNPFDCGGELCPQWLIDGLTDGRIEAVGEDLDYAAIYIETLEGRMKAEPGDWIIKGVKGELYPCKPDIFAATYDPA